MYSSDNKKSLTVNVGEELTKATVVQELSNAKNLLKAFGPEKKPHNIYINFQRVEKVDTLAVVYIVQIERLVSKSSNLKIIYQNVPDDLTSLLNLTSLADIVLSEQ